MSAGKKVLRGRAYRVARAVAKIKGSASEKERPGHLQNTAGAIKKENKNGERSEAFAMRDQR